MGAQNNADMERELTRLVMECPELSELEGRLSRFNIFHVLGAAKHEIRHSNMLAWLLDPGESHGLDDRFLRRWLMTVAQNALNRRDDNPDWPSPIEIDAVDIDEVEVARESGNIDLLLVLRTRKNEKWVVCVENKVESTQHTDQLARYYGDVQRRHADAKRRLYVFLTKYDEIPAVSHFIPSTYAAIESILTACFHEQQDNMGTGPKYLVEQYLELLGEEFVDQNRTAELAQQIYRRHKRAIDFILETRKDPISEGTAAMEAALKAHSEALSVELGPANKGWVRFLPKAWDVPENRGGAGWGVDSRYVLFEICFWTKNVELHLTVGRAPEHWADEVWKMAATKPFKQEWKKRPAQYVKPFKSRSDIKVESLADLEGNDLQKKLIDWLQSEMQKPDFNEAIGKIGSLLPSLGHQ